MNNDSFYVTIINDFYDGILNNSSPITTPTPKPICKRYLGSPCAMASVVPNDPDSSDHKGCEPRHCAPNKNLWCTHSTKPLIGGCPSGDAGSNSYCHCRCKKGYIADEKSSTQGCVKTPQCGIKGAECMAPSPGRTPDDWCCDGLICVHDDIHKMGPHTGMCVLEPPALTPSKPKPSKPKPSKPKPSKPIPPKPTLPKPITPKPTPLPV